MVPAFIPILAAVLGILVVIGVGPIAARLGGWTLLAQTYAAIRPFGGRKQLASGAMGAANYGFSLLLGADSQGLSLETTGFVRTGHVPLFIPWSDVQAKEVPGLVGPRILVEFAKAPGVVLRLTKKTVLGFKEFCGVPRAFPGIS